MIPMNKHHNRVPWQPPPPPPPPPPGGGTLAYPSSLTYLGQFRVHQDNAGKWDFGNGCVAYNSANNSLFYTGGNDNQSVCEVAIATPVNSSTISNLNTASILQAWISPAASLQNKLINTGGATRFGGLLVDNANNRLIGTQYAEYTGANSQVLTHWYLDSLTLASANIQGLYQVGTSVTNNRGKAGMMCWLPAAWAASFGHPAFTGLAAQSINATCSNGPCASGFTPADIGDTPIVADTYLNYPANGLDLGPYTGPANPIWGGSTDHRFRGMTFLEGYDTVLYFGTVGANLHGYGTGPSFNDTTATTTGPHTLNGEYVYGFWFYNANDLLAVKNGDMQPYQVQPYYVYHLTFPNMQQGRWVGGIAHDHTNKKLYIPLLRLDQNPGPTNYLPLIQVFSYGDPSETKPRVGTLCGTPINVGTGSWDGTYNPVSGGKTVRITAGNVYAPPDKTITSVNLYKGGVLVGAMTNDATPKYTKNWIYNYDTTGLSGNQALTAVATDSSDATSDATAYTLVMA